MLLILNTVAGSARSDERSGRDDGNREKAAMAPKVSSNTDVAG
jgi:hypothetical protein